MDLHVQSPDKPTGPEPTQRRIKLWHLPPVAPVISLKSSKLPDPKSDGFQAELDGPNGTRFIYDLRPPDEHVDFPSDVGGDGWRP